MVVRKTAVVGVFLTFTTILCQVCLIQGSKKENCGSSLGMSNGRINDSQLSASSYYKNFVITSKNHHDMNSKYGRLNNQYAWCTDESHDSWLTVSLHRVAIVTGIATQGFKNYYNHYYVKEYQLEFSMDGKIWKSMMQNGGIRSFTGNLHADDTVRNNFTAIQARYIKVIPTSYKYRICMRIELYGCYNDTTPKPSTTQITSTVVPSTSRTTTVIIEKRERLSKKTEMATMSTVSLHASQNPMTGKMHNQHDAVNGNLKSPKINIVLLGSCIGGAIVLIVCMIISCLVVRRRRCEHKMLRKQRNGNFGNFDNEIADNECLSLDNEPLCVNSNEWSAVLVSV